MTTRIEVSSRARRLVDEFAYAAGVAYWQQDQGYDLAVVTSEQRAAARRTALLKFIGRLERKAAKAAGVK